MALPENRWRTISLAWLFTILLGYQPGAAGIRRARKVNEGRREKVGIRLQGGHGGLPVHVGYSSSLVRPALPQARSATNSPSWIRDGVIYEIFPRDFSSAGDLNGVTRSLDGLKQLGVTILWLMPIHPIGVKRRKGTFGSPYSIRDYYLVNPAVGTKSDLLRLVREAHRRDMKVIMDLVAGHTSWDSVMMKSPGFYKHNSSGRIISPEPDWADVAALDYSNPELRRYMLRVAEYWVRNFDVDGFRCDAADRVPLDFWQSMRAGLRKIKPEIFLLDEAYRPDFLAGAFDADYSWPLFHSIEAAISGEKAGSSIKDTWDNERLSFPSSALHMRFIDDHDELRAIAKFGVPAALAASAFIFTIDGVPLIYNGMEAGDTGESGAPALFERLPIFWKIGERRPEFHRAFHELIALRRGHPALRSSDLTWIDNSDPSRVLTYLRKGSSEEMIIAINLSNRPFSGAAAIESPAGYTEITPEPYRMSRQTQSGAEQSPSTNAQVKRSHDSSPPSGADAGIPSGLPELSLPPWGVKIFLRHDH